MAARMNPLLSPFYDLSNVVPFPLVRARCLRADYPRGPALVFIHPSISFDAAVDLIDRLLSQGHGDQGLLAVLGTNLKTRGAIS